ncbi:hypothetical protein FOZ62_003608 [Perkinsus olseni]|uniref:Reverse transcriptase domain-containing protein n=1 Tax=Perkinsus olseni TaxID=32597 RepID=A0A7J6UF61_PEROL|nr:hypothetical protein FOZ62_003608 [Perkinsus olseni]
MSSRVDDPSKTDESGKPNMEAEVYLTLWLEGEAITAGPHMVRVLYSEQVEDKLDLATGTGNVMRYIDRPGGGRGEEGKVIYPVLPRQEQEVARKVIATLVDKGELVVEGLSDYRLSFGRLEEHSQRVCAAAAVDGNLNQRRRDCEGQEVAVFIDLPKKGDDETTELRIPRYERAAYSKLEEAHRAVYRKLVQEFVDRGWWVKKSELQSLGGVSSSRRATSDVLIAVRLNGGDLIVADLQKADYRCRLLDRWVLLATAIGEFVSDRVAFGLHFGAGCLQGAVKEIIMTMLELMKGLSEEQILLFILYYMDDTVIQGAEVEGIVRAFACLFAILRILGFVAQCDKLWAVVRPGNEEQFGQYCKEYGVVVPLSTEGTLLGVGVRLERRKMLLDCRLAQRWSTVTEFLDSTTWMKSSTFACAGVLAHDSVQGHPTLRLIGDVLRAIVGKTFSSWTWDRPFTIDNFVDGVKTAFEEIGKWISEKKPAQEYVHASSLQLESGSIFLTLETDSSLLGWGFSLWATRQEGVTEFCSEAEGKCFEILGAAGRCGEDRSVQ